MMTWDLWSDWLTAVQYRAATVLHDCFFHFPLYNVCVWGASMMTLLQESVCWLNCRYHSPHWGERRGRGSRTKQAAGEGA